MTDLELRQRLVDRLERAHVLTDARIASALLAVPRHRFVPQVSETEAYEDRALPIKERNGEVISSISQPGIVVQMLQLLDVQPEQSILEVGTGSGYNAALLAHLTGPSGTVLSIDIEPDLIERARALLGELGCANVRVEDGSVLQSLTTPYDRIEVTACSGDVDEVWWRLLKDGGRIVVPLDIGYGGERATGFVREGTRLRSIGSYGCLFIGMRTGERHRESDVFFPNRSLRYDAKRRGDSPASIVAVRRADATAALMDEADIIVARPSTIFALRF